MSLLLLFPGTSVDQALTLPFMASGTVINTPTVAAAGALALPTISSTLLFVPSVAPNLAPPSIAGTLLFAPALTHVIFLPYVTSVQLYTPTLVLIPPGTLFFTDVELTLVINRTISINCDLTEV